MSETQAHPENEEEYEDRRQELIADAAETKQELDEKQADALEAISAGGDVEDYETVTLGELELECKAWLPGDVTETVQRAQELGESEDVNEVRESMETMLEALAEMTTAEDYNPRFWQAYYEKYGPEGLLVAVETILEPATEGMEERQEGVESFRSG